MHRTQPVLFSFIAYVLLLTLSTQAKAQDTVRICTYNLLNYGNSANPHATKKAWLQPILQEIKPAILGVEEVSTALPGAVDSLLPLMPFPAVHGSVYNTTGNNQMSTLLWDSTKFGRLQDSSICNSVRDISAYQLYYKHPSLATGGDTIKLTVIVAHLKASNTSADAATRATETQCVAGYLAGLPDSSNVILMGDLNIYKSSEAAYQNLVNPFTTRARLNDPLQMLGNWNGSASFSGIHTQSTRYTAISDGGASGGLDSRFDFILVSDAIISGNKGIRYVPSSYQAFGNDGQHFNKSLTDVPANSAVSYQTTQNLYYMSDHLPVVAGFTFTPTQPSAVARRTFAGRLLVVNPFSERIVFTGVSESFSYTLISPDGRIVQIGSVASSETEIRLYSMLSAGIYFLRLCGNTGSATYRLLHR